MVLAKYDFRYLKIDIIKIEFKMKNPIVFGFKNKK